MDDNRPVDLHVHTVYSDGDLTPPALVRAALASNLAAAAVTDHDTVLGVEPVLSAAEGTGLEIIPGVELSASRESTDIHVLGYFVDLRDPSFIEALEQFQQARYERACEMVRRLRKMGLRVRIDLVMTLAGEGTVGRPHVAQALLEQGLIASFEEAFEKYIGYRGPAYVPKYELAPADAFALIRKAGGVAALAHPGTLRRDEWIPDFVEQGMEAIEVWHPRHADSRRAYYEQLAQRHGLAMTGGSDSHGGRTGLANFSPVKTTYAAVRELKAITGARRSRT